MVRIERLKQISCEMHNTEKHKEVKLKRKASYSNSSKNLKSSELTDFLISVGVVQIVFALFLIDLYMPDLR